MACNALQMMSFFISLALTVLNGLACIALGYLLVQFFSDPHLYSRRQKINILRLAALVVLMTLLNYFVIIPGAVEYITRNWA